MFRTYQVAASGPDVHHDALLTNLAIRAFDTGVDQFIGEQLLPEVPISKQSDKYPIIDPGQFMRVPNTRRAPRTKANRIDWEVSSDSYFAHNYALATDIALEDLDNSDAPFALRENGTTLVTTDLRRDQEVRIANLLTSATNLGSGSILAGANRWSDPINSDPLGDITTAHAFIEHTTGLVANTCMMDFDTYKVIRRHPDLLDLYKAVRGGFLTAEQIAEAFDVDRLLIGRGVRENSLQGGTSSMTSIWGNNCLLAYIEPNAPSTQTRTLGLRFRWRPGNFPAPMAVTTARRAGAGTENIEIIQAEYYQDEKIVAANLGYLIASTL